MTISALATSPDTDAVMQELEKYDLVQHALELTAYGVTVVPPEKMGVDEDFVERLKTAILRTCERRNGIEIGDPETCTMRFSELNERIWYLLKEDDVFIEAATNPSALAMARWLLGRSAVLSGTNWIIKPRNREPLDLHSDAHGIPPGGGGIAHHANLSWLYGLHGAGRRPDGVRAGQSSVRARDAAPREGSADDAVQDDLLEREGGLDGDLERLHLARGDAARRIGAAGDAGAKLHAAAHAADSRLVG